MPELFSLHKWQDAVDKARGSAPVLIAIDGRGGSGKSTLGRLIERAWTGSAVIKMDDFYLPKDSRPSTPDVPGSNYEFSRLRSQVLAPIKAGVEARYQRYDWDLDALTEWHQIQGVAYLIVEGTYSSHSSLRDFFDYKVWVESPQSVRLNRGVLRDGEAMRAMWTDVWMPMEDLYIDLENPASSADLLLDGSSDSNTFEYFVISDRLASTLLHPQDIDQ